MFFPSKKGGTCMLQSWVHGFNPDNPSNLAFPTWDTLRSLSYKHHDHALDNSKSLREVICIDSSNASTKDPR